MTVFVDDISVMCYFKLLQILILVDIYSFELLLDNILCISDIS